MLKRIILVMGLAFTVLACSKSDEISQEAKEIQPPHWIQGTWKLNESMINVLGWKFTSNDVYIIQSDSDSSQKQQTLSLKASGDIEWTENHATEDVYHLTLHYPNGHEVNYEFERKGAIVITWMEIPDTQYIRQ